MFVYIAHAEADQAAAEDLKAFLKTRGLVVETEDGSRGFRHLQHSDVVVALWSQKSVFGTHRMVMERRMLEAWADQRLVLVKLDHGFLPVGLRDLPAIDASFESGRQLSVWPQVERKAKEAMNAALVEREAAQDAFGPTGGAPGGPQDADAPVATQAVDKKSKGGIFSGLFKKKEAAAPATRAAPKPPSAAAPAAEIAAPEALFISYAHADDAAVTPVVALVEANGRAVWIDKTGIKTGDGWAGEIVRAIKSAHGVIVMCSKHSFESDHVKREVYLADRYKKPMAPVFIEQASPPEDFEYFFANVQWLELWKLPEADRAAAIGQALKAV
jgi:hypothetical protein